MVEEKLFEKFQIEFGKQVRASRLRLGLSQEQLAEMMNTCSACIRKIEQGKANIHVNNFMFLIYSLDIDIKSLQEEYIMPYLSMRKEETNIHISVD